MFTNIVSNSIKKRMKKHLRILFRTAGGRSRQKELGLGHIFRCINLADQLGSSQRYFAIQDYGTVRSVIRSKGYNRIFDLPKSMSVKSDVIYTKKIITENDIDVLIIDQYRIKNEYVQAMRNFVKTVIITDLEKINYDADLIINGFIGFPNKMVRNKYRAKCLLGPKYQILSKKFEDVKNLRKKKYDLLITVGGFDSGKILSSIAKQLTGSKLKTKIILGPATIKSKEIEFLHRLRHLDVISKTDHMEKEIANAKFGICSGGITSYEFACMKIPFAIVCQYKHQLKTAKEWNRRKIALNLGLPSKDLESKMRHVFANIDQHITTLNAKSVVDGKGARRISCEIKKLARQ